MNLSNYFVSTDTFILESLASLLTEVNYIFTGRSIEISLSRQTRVDPTTEARYNEEIGTPIYYNFPQLYLLDYCNQFLAKCDAYCQRIGKEIRVN